MDLPTCPACGQSVLDDDVDDCPFCGASLSGSPAPKPKPEKSAKNSSKPSSGRSGSGSATATAASSGTATKEAPAEDDPFALERAAATRNKIVPLKPKPEPGRRHEVVCPMCETIGFTARKAAGMEVKCANPNCDFPNFTAPALPKEDEDESEQEAAPDASLKRLLTPVNIGVGVGAIAVLIVAVIMLTKKPKDVGIPPGGTGPILPRPNGKSVSDKSKSGKSGLIAKTKKKSKLQKRTELRDERLLALRSNADSGILTRLTKIIARHLSADAFARAEQTDKAEETMQQLKTAAAGSGGDFYLVRPLTTLARVYRALGDAAKSSARLSEAQQITAELHADVERPRYDSIVQVAAELVATGKSEEARKLIAAPKASDDPNGRLRGESLVLFSAITLERDDFEAAMANRHARRPSAPLAMAVTLLLAKRGEWKAAKAWAQSQTGVGKHECVSAWAEARVAFTPVEQHAELPAMIDPLITPMPSVERAIAHARLAIRYHLAGNKQAAANHRKSADALVKVLQIPTQANAPGLKDVPTFKPKPDTEWQLAEILAAAHLELAHAQWLAGDTNSGAKLVGKAQDIVRSLSFPLATAIQLENATPAQVARAFNLDDSNQIKSQHGTHRNAVRAVVADAKKRFDLQTAHLELVLDWGIQESLPAVWKIVEAGTQRSVSENWYAATIPVRLQVMAHQEHNKTLTETLFKARRANARLKGDNPKRDYWYEIESRLNDKRFSDAADHFKNKKGVNASWRRLYALSVASRLLNDGQFDAAFEFCKGLYREPALQMIAFELLAARTVHKHGPIAGWAKFNGKPLVAHESAAINYGIIRSIDVPSKKPEPKKKPKE